MRRRLDVVTLAGFSDHGDDQEERGPSLGDRILTKTEGAVAGRHASPGSEGSINFFGLAQIARTTRAFYGGQQIKAWASIC